MSRVYSYVDRVATVTLTRNGKHLYFFEIFMLLKITKITTLTDAHQDQIKSSQTAAQRGLQDGLSGYFFRSAKGMPKPLRSLLYPSRHFSKELAEICGRQRWTSEQQHLIT